MNFSATCPPDIQPNTRMISLCGITDYTGDLTKNNRLSNQMKIFFGQRKESTENLFSTAKTFKPKIKIVVSDGKYHPNQLQKGASIPLMNADTYICTVAINSNSRRSLCGHDDFWTRQRPNAHPLIGGFALHFLEGAKDTMMLYLRNRSRMWLGRS